MNCEELAKLLMQTPTALVVIEDADTDWLLDVRAAEACEHHENVIKLTCGYHDSATLGTGAKDVAEWKAEQSDPL